MKPWIDYINTQITIETFVHILKNFRDDPKIEPLFYSRYGDGEFSAIFGEDGSNCDGHIYFKKMGKELELTLRQQSVFGYQFYFGLVPIAVKVFGDRIDNYIYDMFTDPQLGTNHRSIFGPQWVSGNILMEANREGNLGEFFQVCKNFRTLYVGPKRLKDGLLEDDFLNITHWVEVPERNAYIEFEDIQREIIYQMMKNHCSFVGFSAGMSTKIWISNLKKMFGKMIDVPLVDFGSMFDGYYDFNSRKYHHEYNWDEIREKNLK